MLVKNSIENQAVGENITSALSGGNGDNAWDRTEAGTSGTKLVIDVDPASGNQAARFTTTTASSKYLEWTTTVGTKTELHFLLYVRLTASPTTTTPFFTIRNGSGECFSLALTTGRRMRIRNLSQATVGGDFTTAFPLNQWVRVEGSVYLANNTATDIAQRGHATVRQWNSWDETTTAPTQEKTVGTDGTVSFRGAGTTYRFGVTDSIANVAGLDLDYIALSDEGAIAIPADAINNPPTVTHTVTRENTRAAAAVFVGDVAVIDAEASHPSNGAATYAYAMVSQPTGSTPINLGSETTSVVRIPTSQAGRYVFTRATTVNGKTRTDTISIDALPYYRKRSN